MKYKNSFAFSASFLFLLYSLLILGLSSPAQAQLIPGTQPQETEETEIPEFPQDSLNRRTPQGTVSGFIRAISNQNYNRASRFLELNNNLQGEEERENISRQFQRLLDRGGNIMPYSWLSDDPAGRTDDNLPEGIDRVGSISSDGETIQLFVERTEDPEGAPVWLFSSETVSVIAAITIDDVLLVERILPDFLKNNQWGGVPVGQWLVLLFLVGLFYLLAVGIVQIVLFLIRKFWKQAQTEPTSGILTALALPAKLFLAVVFFVEFSQAAGISIIIRQRFNEFTVVVGIFAILILLWRLSDFFKDFSQKRMTMKGHLSGVSIVLFLRRLAKIAIVVFGLIALLGAFGVDVTAGLAALGIGGLALALGAQKSIENFVGSVTLIADRPIRVGDFCKIGDTMGTVEQIGMRSTRIRTLDRTLVTIPNGELSSTKTENFAHRDKFRLYSIFGMRYETSADQMRYLLVELRAILYAHPKVDPDPARIRFVEYGAASLNLEIFAFINATDFNDYLEVKEDILLRMMDVVEKSGTGFAFPSQTLYLARDKGLSEEKTRHAEEQARKWKEEGEMQIPGFDPDRIEQLKNSIPYPPEGSSRRTNEEKLSGDQRST